MSKILANQIANYGDNSPVEVKEGVNIPAGKPLQADGVSGASGQVLSSTGTSIQWIDNFSGSYTDLINRPTIPAAQVKSDWNAIGTIAEILNKPIVPPQPSVTVNTPGFANLVYNSINGEFTYTPPDLSSYATSVDLSTAVANSSNWDTAYSWGDHATSGYAYSTDIANATNWDTAYSWGDHSSAGYLTSYTETDPVFDASPAGGITSTQVTNWDTAYTWGDHSTQGYLTNISGFSIGNLSDVNLLNPIAGQVLKYDGANWIAQSDNSGNIIANVTISDTAPGSPSSGDLWWESDKGRLKVYYNDTDSSQWVDASPPLQQDRIATSSAPSTATSPGSAGEIRYDANYVYICVATNTWKRAALTTW